METGSASNVACSGSSSEKRGNPLEYDFTRSKRGIIPKTAKERITIRLDSDIAEGFRSQAKGGGNYQTRINEALCKHIERHGGADLESTLRRVLREELSATNP